MSKTVKNIQPSKRNKPRSWWDEECEIASCKMRDKIDREIMAEVLQKPSAILHLSKAVYPYEYKT